MDTNNSNKIYFDYLEKLRQTGETKICSALRCISSGNSQS